MPDITEILGSGDTILTPIFWEVKFDPPGCYCSASGKVAWRVDLPMEQQGKIAKNLLF